MRSDSRLLINWVVFLKSMRLKRWKEFGMKLGMHAFEERFYDGREYLKTTVKSFFCFRFYFLSKGVLKLKKNRS